ncbi:histidinol dehydrogenase [Chloroflexota bacterium]
MQIIEGLSKAKMVLSRENAGLYSISDGVRESVEKLFGTSDPEQAVVGVITDVSLRGDAALRDYTLKIDGIELASLEIAREQIDLAYRETDDELIEALKFAAGRIRAFHLTQKDTIYNNTASEKDVQIIRPLERVGCYAPGGTATYPSTVLMTAIPARVAGVKEIILMTPPDTNGGTPAATLVAADIAGVDRIFSIGGAQAIAALAYGTESVPRVDMICGPGNVFVMLAKKWVYGLVAIDGLAGPSEVMVIADETADIDYCVAELIAQAEHDVLSRPLLVTTSKHLASQVEKEVVVQLKDLPRRDIAAQSLDNEGKIMVINSAKEAIELANICAPEHLCLMVEGTDVYLEGITSAGCIFVGGNSSVAFGDYVAGPSHVLPTGGTARFASPLNVGDFMKLTNIVNIDEKNLETLGKAVITIARAEGLEAHARSVMKRLNRKGVL